MNNKILNKYSLMLCTVLLIGCSGSPRIEIRDDLAPIACDTTTKPEPVQLADTPPTLVPNPDGVMGYWFTAGAYASIGENLQEIRRWMAQSVAIRDKLAACIDEHNDKAKPGN